MHIHLHDRINSNSTLYGKGSVDIHLHDRINSNSTLYGKGSVDIRSNHVRYGSLLEVYLVGSWHDGKVEDRLSGAGSFGRAREREGV